MSETQKSIFITGAASGLGREVARYFANVGWFVGLADVNEKGLDETAALLPAGQWSRHRLDVTDRAQWKAAVADFAKHTNGHMTVLFNNAGIVTQGNAETVADDVWQNTLDTNVTAVWRMCRLVIPHMRRQGKGAIVNNGSDWYADSTWRVSAHAPLT